MLTFGVCTVPAAGRSMIADPDAKPAMDKWSGLEKDALAALARGDVAAAERDVQKLQAKFGEDSCRVSTLQGQVLEAQGRFKDAEALYERLSAGNPGNQVVRKRLAVVHRQLSGEGKFVKMVQEHLDTFAQDVEAVRLRDGCRVFWRESHVVFCVSVCPCVRVSVCPCVFIPRVSIWSWRTFSLAATSWTKRKRRSNSACCVTRSTPRTTPAWVKSCCPWEANTCTWPASTLRRASSTATAHGRWWGWRCRRGPPYGASQTRKPLPSCTPSPPQS